MVTGHLWEPYANRYAATGADHRRRLGLGVHRFQVSAKQLFRASPYLRTEFRVAVFMGTGYRGWRREVVLQRCSLEPWLYSGCCCIRRRRWWTCAGLGIVTGVWSDVRTYNSKDW